MPALEDLPHLLKLLDDDQPEVLASVRKHLSQYGGDISNQIAGLGIDLSLPDQKRLSRLLKPQRRKTLRQEWSVPSNGLMRSYEDWDTFENLLRLISDFLHDGVALRAPLPDALDLLAAEVEETFCAPTEEDLRIFLFESERFKGNKKDYYSPHNSDLTWVLENETGNPIALAIIFILVGRRLNLDIDACNYPGHFLARIVVDGTEFLVDCYNEGRLISIGELLNQAEISSEAMNAIRQPCPPGVMLKRTLVNLAHAYSKTGEDDDDEELALELATTLESTSAQI